VSTSRGAYSPWLVSVISASPSPLPSKILSRLSPICLLGHPSYLALYLEIIGPDHFEDLSVERFWALLISSMIHGALCELPRSPSPSIGRRSSSALPQSCHRIPRDAPVTLKFVSQTLILRQDLFWDRWYLLLVVVRSLRPCVIEKFADFDQIANFILFSPTIINNVTEPDASIASSQWTHFSITDLYAHQR